jgi:hypothetical protein
VTTGLSSSISAQKSISKQFWRAIYILDPDHSSHCLYYLWWRYEDLVLGTMVVPVEQQQQRELLAPKGISSSILIQNSNLRMFWRALGALQTTTSKRINTTAGSEAVGSAAVAATWVLGDQFIGSWQNRSYLLNQKDLESI